MTVFKAALRERTTLHGTSEDLRVGSPCVDPLVWDLLVWISALHLYYAPIQGLRDVPVCISAWHVCQIEPCRPFSAGGLFASFLCKLAARSLPGIPFWDAWPRTAPPCMLAEPPSGVLHPFHALSSPPHALAACAQAVSQRGLPISAQFDFLLDASRAKGGPAMLQRVRELQEALAAAEADGQAAGGA
eukprot:365688-Chlamydomonas_euryale.AAC.22